MTDYLAKAKNNLANLSIGRTKIIVIAVILVAVIFCLCLCGRGGNNKFTLMIYMVGSDLESKSGMGTEDIQEIVDSGVDLNNVNVVICAGGTEKWRNDDVSPDCINIMHLERSGFTVDEKWDDASMGDPATLTKFVDYCAKTYNDENYALILWDHGNGPVMGFGMDTLHDRDSLTLPEMREAMDASVFGGDKKLAWVGFDACLMASAELACVWSDYANYLIASQEVEPSFGWHYSFLKKADKLDTPKLIGYIAETYLDSCKDYYKEKGYEDRDTTISCMDLSKAEALEEAVNSLFSKAADDVDSSYNLLAGRRINTRALGRATTGSEYDLVDLNDAASQLSTYYPEETAAVQKALEDMIITNETNADNLCGLSLYYPFFNKYYYENSWEAAYKELGIFTEYDRYLSGYGETWLGEDKFSGVSDARPTLAEENKYTLKLTPEQAESFGEARIHVMMHETGDAYLPVFTSADVTYDEASQTLTANYDGKALYVINDLGKYTMPISTLISNENGTPHYAVNCSVYKYSPNDLWDMTPEEQEENFGESGEFTRAWFNLSVNTDDSTVKMSSLLARDDEDVTLDNLQTGKAEELAEDDWDYYLFLLDSSHILTRNTDGVILPFDEWNTGEGFSYSELTRYNGLKFEYAPLEAGEYSIIFEITDTQGNRYCSEPAPIDSSDSNFRENETKKPTVVNWDSGEKIKLLDKDGLTLYLKNMENDGVPIQTFELTNNTEDEVLLETVEPNSVVNGEIDVGVLPISIRAKPGETSTTTSTVFSEEAFQEHLDFGIAEMYGFIDKVETLDFTVSAHSMETHKIIWNEEPFTVNYSDETTPPLNKNTYLPANGMESAREWASNPYLGASADEQVLFENDDLEYKLISLGADESGYEKGMAVLTNKSDSVQYLSIDGAVYNGIYLDILDQISIMPHTVFYDAIPWISYEMEDFGITEIHDLSFAIRNCHNRNFGIIGYGDVTWCPVKLKTNASGNDAFPEGERTLYEKDGLRVNLVKYVSAEEGGGSPEWILSIENNTDKDLSIGMTEMVENGVAKGNAQGMWRTMLMYSKVGAHQKRTTILYGNEEVDSIAFKLLIMSFTGDRILETSDEIITLSRE